MNWRAFLSYIALVCLMALLATAQTVPYVKVRGRVVDATTGEPLTSVNVFIANTMLGAATRDDGIFEIRSIPVGVYDLVVSMVGYETKMINLKLTDAVMKPLDVRLKQRLIETALVEITAEDPSEWRALVKRFERLFIGTTRNSISTVLVNPEVLDLKADKSVDQFEATSSAPLIIENRALGYRMHFIMQLFVERQGVTKYGGIARFEELTATDEKERKRWVDGRLRVYRGSRRHFFSALFSNRLKEEGFDASIVSSIAGGARTAGMRRRVDGAEILTKSEKEYEKIVNFSDFLEVTYKEESEEAAYLDFPGKIRPSTSRDTPTGLLSTRTWRDETRGEQTSWLSMQRLSTIVNSSGQLYDPLTFVVYGYWSFERIADTLPLEYLPSAPQ